METYIYKQMSNGWTIWNVEETSQTLIPVHIEPMAAIIVYWLLACYFLTWFAPVTCTRLLSWQGVQTKWQLQGGVWAVHHWGCDGGGVWCHNPWTEIPEERERGNLSPERYWTMSSMAVLYSWNYNSCFTHEL